MSEAPAIFCPVCEHVLTRDHELGQVFPRCSKCEGAFFCDDGLARYVVASTRPSVAPVFEQLLSRALAAAPRDSTSIRPCPRCHSKLERFGFGDHPFAILDRCPEDEAIWLDAGDLDKVVRICQSEALVVGALPDADQDGVPDPLEAAADAGPVPSTATAPYACPNCAQFFGGGPKCPQCNVVGYLR